MNFGVVASSIRKIVVPPVVPPDYSSLDSSFTYFAPVNPSTVFQDTTMVTAAVDNSIAKAIVERKSSKHILWASSDNRKGYYNTKYGAPINRDYPVYKYPVGDIPHIHYTNYLDVYLTNSTITPIVGPCTKHFLLRSRRGVNFETLTSPSQVSIKDFSTTMQIGSTASSGAFVTVTGAPLITEDVWTLVSVVLNGSSSQLYYNGIQQGSNVTVGSGTVSDFGHGTISHIYEMDLAFDALNNSALTGSQILAISNAVNAIVPLNTLPSGLPYARNVNVTFDGTDTFNTTFTYVAGSGSIAIDSTKTEYRWLSNDAGANGGNGLNGLDAQKLVFNHGAPSIKRSNFPSYFRPGSIGVVNNANIACEVKVYDLNGRSLGWISSRSRYTPDATTGTPDGTYAPVTISGVINNALPSSIDITYSAAINNTTGTASDFEVTVDGVNSIVTGISFQSSTVLRVTHTLIPTNTTEVIVKLRQGITNPLKGTNGKICESFVSSTLDGPFIKLVNNIAGPQTAKVNITNFNGSTLSTGWVNIVDSLNTTGVKGSVINDIVGVSTGVSLNITNVFEGAAFLNTSGGTDVDIPDSNITLRTYYEYGNGTDIATIRMQGFTPGKTADFKLKFYKDATFPTGSGTGVVTWTDNTGTSNSTISNNLTISTVNKTGLIADSNGYITFSIKADTGNFAVGLIAIIFTKYP